MWVVVQYNRHEEDLFKNEMKLKFGQETRFYSPKAIVTKIINNSFKKVEKKLINNYLLCFNEKFKDKNFLNIIRTIKGLNNMLAGSLYNQKNILDFLHFCKKNEDLNGFLKFDFFKENITKNKDTFFSKIFPNLNYKLINEKKSFSFFINGKLVRVKNKPNIVFNPI
tara:strand:- start:1154 stop:1654 length:501 start_codon:yes stop_codon:yes gene_type:complete